MPLRGWRRLSLVLRLGFCGLGDALLTIFARESLEVIGNPVMLGASSRTTDAEEPLDADRGFDPSFGIRGFSELPSRAGLGAFPGLLLHLPPCQIDLPAPRRIHT